MVEQGGKRLKWCRHRHRPQSPRRQGWPARCAIHPQRTRLPSQGDVHGHRQEAAWDGQADLAARGQQDHREHSQPHDRLDIGAQQKAEGEIAESDAVGGGRRPLRRGRADRRRPDCPPPGSDRGSHPGAAGPPAGGGAGRVARERHGMVSGRACQGQFLPSVRCAHGRDVPQPQCKSILAMGRPGSLP